MRLDVLVPIWVKPPSAASGTLSSGQKDSLSPSIVSF